MSAHGCMSRRGFKGPDAQWSGCSPGTRPTMLPTMAEDGVITWLDFPSSQFCCGMFPCSNCHWGAEVHMHRRHHVMLAPGAGATLPSESRHSFGASAQLCMLVWLKMPFSAFCETQRLACLVRELLFVSLFKSKEYSRSLSVFIPRLASWLHGFVLNPSCE